MEIYKTYKLTCKCNPLLLLRVETMNEAIQEKNIKRIELSKYRPIDRIKIALALASTNILCCNEITEMTRISRATLCRYL